MTDLEDKDYSFNPLYIPFKLEVAAKSGVPTQPYFFNPFRYGSYGVMNPIPAHLKFLVAENVPAINIEGELVYTLSGTQVYTSGGHSIDNPDGTGYMSITMQTQVRRNGLGTAISQIGGLFVNMQLNYTKPVKYIRRITTKLEGVRIWDKKIQPGGVVNLVDAPISPRGEPVPGNSALVLQEGNYAGGQASGRGTGSLLVVLHRATDPRQGDPVALGYYASYFHKGVSGRGWTERWWEFTSNYADINGNDGYRQPPLDGDIFTINGYRSNYSWVITPGSTFGLASSCNF